MIDSFRTAACLDHNTMKRYIKNIRFSWLNKNKTYDIILYFVICYIVFVS